MLPYMQLRDAPKKKMQLNYGLLPKGGGVPRQSKNFGTLFVHQPFWNFGQKKGGGVDQIQKFLGTFYPDFGEIRPKKCPKSSKKKITLRKSILKVPKVWVGGGSDLFGRSP